MLSRILHKHPDVLCVSEFFGTLMRVMHERVFPIADLDGRELWRMLTTPFHFFDAAIRDGLRFPELCYPYGSGRFDPVTAPSEPGSRSEPGTGVPMISHITLPMITDDPDGLYDQLAAEIPRWPARPAASQYRALFALLADLLERRIVVERSSTSLSVVPLLRQQFPEARFVHMHRDGPDCALSLSGHPLFRMAGLRAAAVRAAGLSSWDEIEAELRRLYQLKQLPPEFNGLIVWPFDAQRFMAYPIPVAFFGQMWSRMVCEGVPALSELPPEAWTGLRYEDLLRDSEAELTRLAGFLGVPASSRWLAAARQLIDSRGNGSGGAAAAQPGQQQLDALREACAPGTRAIADADARRSAPAAAHSVS